MKPRYLSLCALAVGVLSVASAQDPDTQNNDFRYYLVPGDASGAVVKLENGDYEGQLLMTDSIDGTYVIHDVDLPYPYFSIVAEGVDHNDDTLYAVESYAVMPAPVNLPTPLTATPSPLSRTTIELPAAGTYSIEFYSNELEGIRRSMVIARPAEDNPVERYPRQLYLVPPTGKPTVVEGDPKIGYYGAYIPLPSQFKISYEPNTREDAFVFGPTTADGATTTFTREDALPIAYATGTSTYIAPEEGLLTDNQPLLISLADGYIAIDPAVLTGIEAPEAEATTAATYYTLQGYNLGSNPSVAHGTLLIRVDGRSAQKLIY